MLTQDERIVVTDELARALLSDPNVRAFVAAAIVDPIEVSRFLSAFPTDLRDVRSMAEHVVSLCVTDRWNARPSWLEAIVVRVAMIAHAPDLVDLAKRIRSGADPNPDPYDVAWLAADTPFFDRKQLRALARTLLTTTNRPVLRINGPSGSGRSYTSRVLGHFGELLPAKALIVSTSVPEAFASVYTLLELVEELVIQIPVVGNSSVPVQTASSYPAQLVRWFLGKVQTRPELVVIILEGAEAQGVREDIRLFAAELAQRVCTPALRQRLRLILIDHLEPLVGVLPADIDEEVLQNADQLAENDILPCLRELNARRELLRKPPLPVPLPDIADAILRQAAAMGKARLRYVHDSLRALLLS